MTSVIEFFYLEDFVSAASNGTIFFPCDICWGISEMTTIIEGTDKSSVFME